MFTNYCSSQSAVLFKSHHCLADGYSMARILLQGCKLGELPASSSTQRSSGGKVSWMATLSKVPSAITKLLFQAQDPASTLKPSKMMEGTSPRAASWGECDLSIARLKELGKMGPVKFSINDLMFAALCGALCRYARDKGTVPDVCQTALWYVNFLFFFFLFFNFFLQGGTDPLQETLYSSVGEGANSMGK